MCRLTWKFPFHTCTNRLRIAIDHHDIKIIKTVNYNKKQNPNTVIFNSCQDIYPFLADIVWSNNHYLIEGEPLALGNGGGVAI